MSDTDGAFDDDENGTDNTDTSKANGPKELRQALGKSNKRVSELEAELVTFRKEKRQGSVAAALEKHGARKSIAKFYDADDTSDDAVLAWLEENGENFGWAPDSSSDDDDETVVEAERISRSSSTARPRALGQQLTTEFLRTASRDELIKAGALPADLGR